MVHQAGFLTLVIAAWMLKPRPLNVKFSRLRVRPTESTCISMYCVDNYIRLIRRPSSSGDNDVMFALW